MSQPSEDAFVVLIGEKVRYLRRHQGMSQARLAVLSDYSRPSIVNLEKGKPVTLQGLYRISRALQVNPVALMPTHQEVCDELEMRLSRKETWEEAEA